MAANDEFGAFEYGSGDEDYSSFTMAAGSPRRRTRVDELLDGSDSEWSDGAECDDSDAQFGADNKNREKMDETDVATNRAFKEGAKIKNEFKGKKPAYRTLFGDVPSEQTASFWGPSNDFGLGLEGDVHLIEGKLWVKKPAPRFPTRDTLPGQNVKSLPVRSLMPLVTDNGHQPDQVLTADASASFGANFEKRANEDEDTPTVQRPCFWSVPFDAQFGMIDSARDKLANAESAVETGDNVDRPTPDFHTATEEKWTSTDLFDGSTIEEDDEDWISPIPTPNLGCSPLPSGRLNSPLDATTALSDRIDRSKPNLSRDSDQSAEGFIVRFPDSRHVSQHSKWIPTSPTTSNINWAGPPAPQILLNEISEDDLHLTCAGAVLEKKVDLVDKQDVVATPDVGVHLPSKHTSQLLRFSEVGSHSDPPDPPDPNHQIWRRGPRGSDADFSVQNELFNGDNADSQGNPNTALTSVSPVSLDHPYTFSCENILRRHFQDSSEPVGNPNGVSPYDGPVRENQIQMEFDPVTTFSTVPSKMGLFYPPAPVALASYPSCTEDEDEEVSSQTSFSAPAVSPSLPIFAEENEEEAGTISHATRAEVPTQLYRTEENRFIAAALPQFKYGEAYDENFNIHQHEEPKTCVSHELGEQSLPEMTSNKENDHPGIWNMENAVIENLMSSKCRQMGLRGYTAEASHGMAAVTEFFVITQIFSQYRATVQGSAEASSGPKHGTSDISDRQRLAVVAAHLCMLQYDLGLRSVQPQGQIQLEAADAQKAERSAVFFTEEQILPSFKSTSSGGLDAPANSANVHTLSSTDHTSKDINAAVTSNKDRTSLKYLAAEKISRFNSKPIIAAYREMKDMISRNTYGVNANTKTYVVENGVVTGNVGLHHVFRSSMARIVYFYIVFQQHASLFPEWTGYVDPMYPDTRFGNCLEAWTDESLATPLYSPRSCAVHFFHAHVNLVYAWKTLKLKQGCDAWDHSPEVGDYMVELEAKLDEMQTVDDDRLLQSVFMLGMIDRKLFIEWWLMENKTWDGSQKEDTDMEGDDDIGGDEDKTWLEHKRKSSYMRENYYKKGNEDKEESGDNFKNTDKGILEAPHESAENDLVDQQLEFETRSSEQTKMLLEQLREDLDKNVASERSTEYINPDDSGVEFDGDIKSDHSSAESDGDIKSDHSSAGWDGDIGFGRGGEISYEDVKSNYGGEDEDEDIGPEIEYAPILRKVSGQQTPLTVAEPSSDKTKWDQEEILVIDQSDILLSKSKCLKENHNTFDITQKNREVSSTQIASAEEIPVLEKTKLRQEISFETIGYDEAYTSATVVQPVHSPSDDLDEIMVRLGKLEKILSAFQEQLPLSDDPEAANIKFDRIKSILSSHVQSLAFEIQHPNKDQTKVREKGSQISRLLKDIKHAIYGCDTENTGPGLVNEESLLLSAAVQQQSVEDLAHESCGIERCKKLSEVDFQHREADQRASILEVEKDGSEVARNSWENAGQRKLELSRKLMAGLRECEEIKHIFFDLIQDKKQLAKERLDLKEQLQQAGLDLQQTEAFHLTETTSQKKIIDKLAGNNQDLAQEVSELRKQLREAQEQLKQMQDVYLADLASRDEAMNTVALDKQKLARKLSKTRNRLLEVQVEIARQTSDSKETQKAMENYLVDLNSQQDAIIQLTLDNRHLDGLVSELMVLMNKAQEELAQKPSGTKETQHTEKGFLSDSTPRNEAFHKLALRNRDLARDFDDLKMKLAKVRQLDVICFHGAESQQEAFEKLAADGEELALQVSDLKIQLNKNQELSRIHLGACKSRINRLIGEKKDLAEQLSKIKDELKKTRERSALQVSGLKKNLLDEVEKPEAIHFPSVDFRQEIIDKLTDEKDELARHNSDLREELREAQSENTVYIGGYLAGFLHSNASRQKTITKLKDEREKFAFEVTILRKMSREAQATIDSYAANANSQQDTIEELEASKEALSRKVSDFEKILMEVQKGKIAYHCGSKGIQLDADEKELLQEVSDLKKEPQAAEQAMDNTSPRATYLPYVSQPERGKEDSVRRISAVQRQLIPHEPKDMSSARTKSVMKVENKKLIEQISVLEEQLQDQYSNVVSSDATISHLKVEEAELAERVSTLDTRINAQDLAAVSSAGTIFLLEAEKEGLAARVDKLQKKLQEQCSMLVSADTISLLKAKKAKLGRQVYILKKQLQYQDSKVLPLAGKKSLLVTDKKISTLELLESKRKDNEARNRKRPGLPGPVRSVGKRKTKGFHWIDGNQRVAPDLPNSKKQKGEQDRKGSEELAKWAESFANKKTDEFCSPDHSQELIRNLSRLTGEDFARSLEKCKRVIGDLMTVPIGMEKSDVLDSNEEPLRGLQNLLKKITLLETHADERLRPNSLFDPLVIEDTPSDCLIDSKFRTGNLHLGLDGAQDTERDNALSKGRKVSDRVQQSGETVQRLKRVSSSEFVGQQQSTYSHQPPRYPNLTRYPSPPPLNTKTNTMPSSNRGCQSPLYSTDLDEYWSDSLPLLGPKPPDSSHPQGKKPKSQKRTSPESCNFSTMPDLLNPKVRLVTAHEMYDKKCPEIQTTSSSGLNRDPPTPQKIEELDTPARCARRAEIAVEKTASHLAPAEYPSPFSDGFSLHQVFAPIGGTTSTSVAQEIDAISRKMHVKTRASILRSKDNSPRCPRKTRFMEVPASIIPGIDAVGYAKEITGSRRRVEDSPRRGPSNDLVIRETHPNHVHLDGALDDSTMTDTSLDEYFLNYELEGDEPEGDEPEDDLPIWKRRLQESGSNCVVM